ncbi:MAG: GNAT family N-acetyltransferase [Candidatus Hydrogenedentes bacterium]|nr:GNAT family N-acetyltransferase [Candidatus Hydrogenedentota bacterium]
MTDEPRFTLRRTERLDLDTIIEWLDDPAFLAFLHGDPTRAPKQLRQHLAAMLAYAAAPMMSGGGFYIIDSDRHGPVGLASLQSIGWRNQNCEFDLCLTEPARAQGLDTACLHGVIGYCFDDLNLHRVSRPVPAPDSEAVLRMEGTGAKREAVLRRHGLRDGTRVDMYLYGLLRSEYRRPAAADRGD